MLSDQLFIFCKSTEKDDDYIVLYHHWNRWILLSLQLLFIKGETGKTTATALTLYEFSSFKLNVEYGILCVCVEFLRKRMSKKCPQALPCVYHDYYLNLI